MKNKMLIKDILNPSMTFHINDMLRIESTNDRFLGPGRIELLEKIIETGSISQAAKLMGMSYKKAWDSIHSINQQTVTPIVITQAGGEKGGGTIVTDEGKLLITSFKQLHADIRLYFSEKIETFLQS
jgi:molybdate transport system regulatory protein